MFIIDNYRFTNSNNIIYEVHSSLLKMSYFVA
jgi:hypothetical protein